MGIRTARALLWAGLLGVAFPAPGRAQDRPSPTIEFPVGWATFVDNGINHHGVFGAAARFYLTPRLSIGPELVYMAGPGSDRDLFVTGNVMFDFRSPGPTGRPLRAVPFVVAGGGLFQNRYDFPTGTFVATDPGFTAGGGVRFWLSERMYVAPEVRTGWEPHWRVSVAVGLALGN